MTVGSQVKGCLSSIKSAEANVAILSEKTLSDEAHLAFKQAEEILTSVKNDLHEQAIKLANEEPQYKS
ncbi:hypothetical protein JNUCC1_00111 [Lentibacillus sp. JNUCC-1]|uniref:DUF1657 domain-containing protein n=1 Tax=Lentibacillus sp. JNUCC-1 TaxID=2654513 RepID=UPI0012E7D667|nr:DUF1657 domain-containing protein [Lentibacillus sp. JNUCC-1]MUV36310.1 hypothetical protein [Lentibacillus sp. JNUCC-1]